jgi:hypothetical protein
LKNPHPGLLKEIVRFQGSARFFSPRIVDIHEIAAHRVPSDTDSSLLMTKSASSTVRTQQHRQRIRAAGMEEVLVKMPTETREFIDRLKESQGLPNRSQALLQLIELGRQAAQQIA